MQIIKKSDSVLHTISMERTQFFTKKIPIEIEYFPSSLSVFALRRIFIILKLKFALSVLSDFLLSRYFFYFIFKFGQINIIYFIKDFSIYGK